MHSPDVRLLSRQRLKCRGSGRCSQRTGSSIDPGCSRCRHTSPDNPDSSRQDPCTPSPSTSRDSRLCYPSSSRARRPHRSRRRTDRNSDRVADRRGIRRCTGRCSRACRSHRTRHSRPCRGCRCHFHIPGSRCMAGHTSGHTRRQICSSCQVDSIRTDIRCRYRRGIRCSHRRRYNLHPSTPGLNHGIGARRSRNCFDPRWYRCIDTHPPCCSSLIRWDSAS